MTKKHSKMQHLISKNLSTWSSVATLAIVATLCLSLAAHAADSNTPLLSSRAAFLRAQRASRQTATNNQTSSSTTSSTTPATTSNTSTTSTTTTSTSTTTTTTQAPSSRSPSSNLINTSTTSRPRLSLISKPKEELVKPLATNRNTRTADVFQNGDGYNIFVTNTCEREQMHVTIRMSKEFYGVIHTKDQRKKAVCSIEGNGATEYNLDISHVLNNQDPNYCGVIKARRESPEDKDLLSVVIAVRFHRNIELSDDKFFLLNCTNRCRRPDCSTPNTSNKLVLGDDTVESGGERESTTGKPTSDDRKVDDNDECTIYKFPWVITLLWCMGIMLLAMIISHCIMCSSLVCKCVKTEVEEREPSVYEDDETDDEDKLYNRKNHPMRIDYDNRDIYKTSNNYEPYRLDEAQREAAEERRARKLKRTSR